MVLYSIPFSPVSASELVYDVTAEVPILWYVPGKVLHNLLVLKIIPGFPRKYLTVLITTST